MGDFIEKSTPVLPISGWMGDNLNKASENMTWWKGQDVAIEGANLHVHTLYDVLDKMCRVPPRPTSAPMRMPISGIYKIKSTPVLPISGWMGEIQGRTRQH